MYEYISLIYNEFMKGVDYKTWSKYLLDLVDKSGVNPTEIIEYGCGTGNLTRYFADELEVKINAVDLSEEMLTQADQVLSDKDNVELFKGDMLEFNLGRPVDLIICTIDSLNILSPEEVEIFFNKVYNELSPGGLLLFDVVSDKFLKNYIALRDFTFETDDVTFIWTSQAHKDYVDFYYTCFIQEGELYRRVDEVQRNYILSPDFIKEALNQAGFDSIKSYRFKTTDESTDNYTRIQYVAQKN